MEELIHTWEHEGNTITFSWLGEADVAPDRVYALAFTQARQMLLVTDPAWAPACWLPGGGIEQGESPRSALERELVEEANAVLLDLASLGTQRAEDSAGVVSNQEFYWCRIEVHNEFSPKHEVTHRVLVEPEDFLDTLFWGRSDPKAAMLLQQALQINESKDTHEP